MQGKVPKRIATAILNSLKGGVVPRVGLGYIAVGREAEISALLTDIDIIEDGGAAFRFIVGRYGSGKSFLLQTMRGHAMDRGFVVADAGPFAGTAAHGDEESGVGHIPGIDSEPFRQGSTGGRRAAPDTGKVDLRLRRRSRPLPLLMWRIRLLRGR